MRQSLVLLVIILVVVILVRPSQAFEDGSILKMVVVGGGGGSNNNNNNMDVIDSICKNTPNYQLCIDTLGSDPRSLDPNTNVFGLGLVVVDALKNKATAALAAIKAAAAASDQNRQLAIPLMECSFRYNAILKADVPVAVEGLRKGVPKFADTAMDDAALEARNCENGYSSAAAASPSPSPSPISALNQDVYDLSLIAKSIIRILL